jgi:hypothetical protein
MKDYEGKKDLERSLYESGISFSNVGKEIANILHSYSVSNLSSNVLDGLIQKIKDYIKKNENEYSKLVEEIRKLKANYNMKKNELRKYISQIEEEYLKRGAVPPLERLEEIMKVGAELRKYEEIIKKKEENKQIIKYSSEIGKIIYKILEDSKEKIERGQEISNDDLISYINKAIENLLFPKKPIVVLPVVTDDKPYLIPGERENRKRPPGLLPGEFPADRESEKKKERKDTEELLDKLTELYKKRSKEEGKVRILGITILLLSSTLFISHLLNISSRGMFVSIPIFNYFTLSITFLMLIVFMFFVISLNKKYKL